MKAHQSQSRASLSDAWRQKTPRANPQASLFAASLPRPRRKNPHSFGLFFATDSIATKPAKPCDGGVFGGFYLLLLLQRNRGCHPGVAVRTMKAGNAVLRPHPSQSRTNQSDVLRQKAAEPRPFAAARAGPAFSPLAGGICTGSRNSLMNWPRTAFATPVPQKHLLFRYRFDSNQVPKTVRWRRF